ncbi:amelogenin X-linked S homeolog isoform X1 [Xenopus laevis]|uniref:Amelogenin X-linked S homeolog isoform X1 n=2 Tax=Xenopus laevis TaxID=8355 RepID=A0A8J1MBC1_XENLA|nr:amelogenin X-linked S homeolog isoform X1 [Xenopus laevis]
MLCSNQFSQRTDQLTKTMRPLVMLTALIGAAFSLPLPPQPQHPGYVNFSYEILSPIKWYQSMMKNQYPNYGYEPVSGWLQSPMIPVPPMMQQQQLPSQNAVPKLPSHHPLLIPQQPLVPVPVHHPLIPLTPQHTHQLKPIYLFNSDGQYPTNTQLLEPSKPDHESQNGQPTFPLHPLPPLVEERPQEPWQEAGNDKQEELD